jgi:hypothetical protein
MNIKNKRGGANRPCGTPLLSRTGSPDDVSVHDFPDRFTDIEVYAEFLGPGDAELAFEFYGPKYDRRHRFRAEATQKIAVWDIGLHSVSLDAQGMPLFEGGRPVLGGLIPPEASLSTYVPYDGGGAPNLVSTSPRWVTFAAVTNAVTNSATLSMTQEHAEGFKVWELDFGGATTNGTFAWQWQGASNEFLRAEIPTNAAGATMPLALAYIDAGFDGQTNEVQEACSLYRHDDTNGFWGSTYSITGPREEIGMPAFSAHNAFIVRVPPEAAFAEGTELVCRLLPEGEEDDAIEAEMERQADGSYVTSLIVPAPEADGGAGLEGWDDARVLNIKDGTVKMVRVEVYNSLLSSGQKITDKKIPVQQAALFSALVSVEEAAGMRVSLGVNAAGEAARVRLKYGVTPLLSPTAEQLADLLTKHSVWIHNGHGSLTNGLLGVREVSQGEYEGAWIGAADLPPDLGLSLVFMNTCDSTDLTFDWVKNLQGIPVGWLSNTPRPVSPHAVYDIGVRLNARNYVGWDCEVPRTVSPHIPKMLMEELDTRTDGELRTVEKAVLAVRERMRLNGGTQDFFKEKLRLAIKDNSLILDLNKKYR